MRLATYNIRDGGRDGHDQARLEQIAAVVRSMDLDVLALQEANGFGADRRTTLRWFEKQTGMRGYLCKTRSGFDVALFVKPSIRVVRSGGLTAGFAHGATYVDLQIDGGEPLRVITAHLSPFHGEERLLEIRHVMRRLALGSRVVLMGDLNSLESQAALSDVLALHPDDRGRYLMPGTTDVVDTRVLEALLGAGFVDTVVAANPGVPPPATAPTKNGGGAEFSQMRLDFIMVRGIAARAIRSAAVITGGLTETASDHYPVVTEIDFLA